jgi:hypothetical protein
VIARLKFLREPERIRLEHYITLGEGKSQIREFLGSFYLDEYLLVQRMLTSFEYELFVTSLVRLKKFGDGDDYDKYDEYKQVRLQWLFVGTGSTRMAASRTLALHVLEHGLVGMTPDGTIVPLTVGDPSSTTELAQAATDKLINAVTTNTMPDGHCRPLIKSPWRNSCGYSQEPIITTLYQCLAHDIKNVGWRVDIAGVDIGCGNRTETPQTVFVAMAVSVHHGSSSLEFVAANRTQIELVRRCVAFIWTRSSRLSDEEIFVRVDAIIASWSEAVDSDSTDAVQTLLNDLVKEQWIAGNAQDSIFVLRFAELMVEQEIVLM